MGFQNESNIMFVTEKNPALWSF